MSLLFAVPQITYHVALLKEDKDRIVLRSIESLPLYAYPDLEREVRELVREFCDYLKRRKLESYLEPKVKEAAQ